VCEVITDYFEVWSPDVATDLLSASKLFNGIDAVPPTLVSGTNYRAVTSAMPRPYKFSTVVSRVIISTP